MVLDVRRIAFHGQTGDDRSPEDFAFPAAMTSMMEYLGEDIGLEVIEAHGRSYTHRRANNDFVAASGIGFALLWDDGLCPSAQDLLQAAPYEKGMENAFAWAGWTVDRVSGDDMKQAAVRAISAGKPFIALGLTDVPEAALICGCDETGDVLYGWSHFQNGMRTIENGMFAASGWMEKAWELVIPGERTGKRMDARSVIGEGVRIMEQEAVGGYKAGNAAYEAWISAIERSEGGNPALYEYHHAILFNFAEARCWCGAFLLAHGIEAGKHFLTIHDLCWKADAAVRNAAETADAAKKAELIAILRAIQGEDQAALLALKESLRR